MAQDIILEICADSIASSLEAVRGGAHRIELCAALPVGGLTPSAGTIRLVRALAPLPLHVLIRPRSGDFFYSADEFAIMREDILTAKALGADGVVLGLLRPDGTIDLNRTAELVQLARPMQVTFHRAFDVCLDPLQALGELMALQIDRLLTSGQQPTAPQGSALIAQLIKAAAGSITVMPGAGINETNAASLIRETGARELHMSLSQQVPSPMTFRRPQVNMGGTLPASEYDHYQANAARIKKIIDQITP